jgi:hypothetical protein
MNSMADFKRLAVVGGQFERAFIDSNVPTSIRTVNHVQSNAVTFRADPGNPSAAPCNRSWFYFPKAKDCRFEDDTLVVLDLDGNPRLTLRYLGRVG